MHTTKRSIAIKAITFLLLVAMLCPVGAFASESRASYYLSSYTAYVYPSGWGNVEVYFNVVGTNDMDEIGALDIKLYESKDNETWSWVKTYTYNNYSGMLGYDDYTHAGHVEYDGTIGRYYKAYVCVWAGKDGAGDTRYFWTPAVKATLFAG